MTCQYRGCPFPTDDICTHHVRMEELSRLGAHSYPDYGNGRTLSESREKKISLRGKDSRPNRYKE